MYDDLIPVILELAFIGFADFNDNVNNTGKFELDFDKMIVF